MKYADIEGLSKKDSFKKGFGQVLKKTEKHLTNKGFRIVPESIGEPAALIDFLKYDFYLAFKTDGVGTKSLIADTMKNIIRKKKLKSPSVSSLYSGLGVDLVASNINDLLCLGATPIALSDEISAGSYHTFTDRQVVRGIYQGLTKGCLEAGITIPSGESPTLIDIIRKESISITGSAIGIISPKKNAIFGQRLTAGDAIYGFLSSGIHTNGLSLARKLVEKLPQGYFTPFGKKTIGEELLTPTKIYSKIISLLLKDKIDIHYMTHISGSSFTKIMRAKKPFTYLISYLPKIPPIFSYLAKLGDLPDFELYQTWNMGIGFVIFAPLTQRSKIERIAKKTRTPVILLGSVKKGPKKVVIKEKNITYEGH